MCLKERLNSRYNSKTLSPTSKVFYAIDAHYMYIPLFTPRRQTSPKEMEMESLPKIGASLLSDIDVTMPYSTSESLEGASIAPGNTPASSSRTLGLADTDTLMSGSTPLFTHTSEASEDSSANRNDAQARDPTPLEEPMGSPVIGPLPNPQPNIASNITHNPGIELPQRETAKSPPDISMSDTSVESEHLREESTIPLQDPLGAADIDPLNPASPNCPGTPVRDGVLNPHNLPKMSTSGEPIGVDNISPLPQHDEAISSPPEQGPENPTRGPKVSHSREPDGGEREYTNGVSASSRGESTLIEIPAVR